MTDTIQKRKMLELLFFEKLQAIEDDPLQKLDALFRMVDVLMEKDIDTKDPSGYTYVFKQSMSKEQWRFIHNDNALYPNKNGFIISLCVWLIKGTEIERFYQNLVKYPRREGALTTKGKQAMTKDWINALSGTHAPMKEEKEKLFSLLEEHLYFSGWNELPLYSIQGIRILPLEDDILQWFCDIIDPPFVVSDTKLSFQEQKRQLEKYNYVGETLKRRRQALNLTQDEAGTLLGVTQAQWSSYELGKTRGNLDVLILIAIHVFKMHPLDLCKECLETLEKMKKHE